MSSTLERFAETAPELLNRLLRSGGSFADCFHEHAVLRQHRLRQRLQGQQLAPPQRTQHRQRLHGTGLRVLAGFDQGFAHADGWDLTALRHAAARAAAVIEASGSASLAAPLVLQHALPSEREPPADPTLNALLTAAADAVFALDDRVRTVQVTLQEQQRRIAVATSDGVLAAKVYELTALRIGITWQEAGAEHTTHALAGSTEGLDRSQAEAAAREAVMQARMRAAARPLPGGTMPVVLAGGWGGVWLHEAVGHLLEADTVAMGASPYAGRLGTPVAAPGVTLVDDATHPGGRGTMPFDDEGAPAGCTPLIEDGVLRSLLTDRRHAHRLNLPYTGNARRQDYRHPPLPRMTNLCLQPGPIAPETLVAEVASGLYVQRIGHGLLQPATRCVAFDVLAGRRIERGRLTHPVTDLRVTGHVPDALSQLIGIADDVQLDAARGVCQKADQVVPVSVGMPTVLLQGLTVTPTANRR